MKKPNFFVVGAAKAGTTSLHSYLMQHPDVFMCPIKEPHYFSLDFTEDNFHPNYKKAVERFDIDDYLSREVLTPLHLTITRSKNKYYELYRDVKKQRAVGECSVGYLYSKVAAKEIARNIGNAKIIIILRNPIDRAYSHWIMNLQRGGFGLGRIRGSFVSTIVNEYEKENKSWGNNRLFIDLGMYCEQVKRYLDEFGHDRVKVILYEDYRSDLNSTLKSIFAHIGVAEGLEIRNKLSLNEGRMPRVRFLNDVIYNNLDVFKFVPGWVKSVGKNILMADGKPLITQEERDIIAPYFENDICKLSDLIGRDLSHWVDYK